MLQNLVQEVLFHILYLTNEETMKSGYKEVYKMVAESRKNKVNFY